MGPGLKVGLSHRQSLVIDASLTVPAVSPKFESFTTMPPVFATAFLVAFVEWACVEAINPHLDPSEDSLGIHVDLSHISPTPVGFKVTAEVELVAVEGRRLKFKVICRDDTDVIGEGFHERAVIDRARFEAKRAAKAARLLP